MKWIFALISPFISPFLILDVPKLEACPTYLHTWQVTSDWSPPVNILSIIQLHWLWLFGFNVSLSGASSIEIEYKLDYNLINILWLFLYINTLFCSIHFWNSTFRFGDIWGPKPRISLPAVVGSIGKPKPSKSGL